ncbi:MAG: xanthine phosphoribosyltransferase [Tissierellales bacterium]|nr:xanthine phosphoribosyltransferase [Tissierellales bacterium]
MQSQILQERILKDGDTKGFDIVKVDSFLNHQIDVTLMDHIGEAFYKNFKEQGITKVLTIEASGIAIAMATARYFDVPVVFAKKVESKNLDDEIYTSEVFSFTKNRTYQVRVSKRYISPDDKILIVDDFLANGKACEGLVEIVESAKAEIKGIGIVIEKGFQPGGANLRGRGFEVQSLAIIDAIDGGKIEFREEV